MNTKQQYQEAYSSLREFFRQSEAGRNEAAREAYISAQRYATPAIFIAASNSLHAYRNAQYLATHPEVAAMYKRDHMKALLESK